MRVSADKFSQCAAFFACVLVSFAALAQAPVPATGSTKTTPVNFVGAFPEIPVRTSSGESELSAEIVIKVNKRGQVESAQTVTANSDTWAQAARLAVASWIVVPSATAECQLEPYETRIVLTANSGTRVTGVRYAAEAFIPKYLHALHGLGPQNLDEKAYLDITTNPNWVAVAAMLTVDNASGVVEKVDIRDLESNRRFARNAERNLFLLSARSRLEVIAFPAWNRPASRQVCLTLIEPVDMGLNSKERSVVPSRR